MTDPRIARIERGMARNTTEGMGVKDLADFRVWQEIAARHDNQQYGACDNHGHPCPDWQVADGALDRLDKLWGVN